MRRHAPLLLTLLLPACAILPSSQPERPETPKEATQRRQEAPKPTYNLAGYPPSVREGYIDGCETAKNSSYGRKDKARFEGDPQYQMGWNDGFGICKKR